MLQIRAGLLGEEDHLVVVILDSNLGLRQDKHDSDHLAVFAVEEYVGLVTVGLTSCNGGSVLDAGVSGKVLVAAGIGNHELCSAVGSDIGGILNIVDGALVNRDAGLVVLQVQSGRSNLVGGLSGINSLQSVDAIVVNLIGNNDGLLLTISNTSSGAPSSVIGLGELAILIDVIFQVIGLGIIFFGGDNLAGAVGKDQLSLLADKGALVSHVDQQSVIADLLNLLNVDDIAILVEVSGVVVLHGQEAHR